MTEQTTRLLANAVENEAGLVIVEERMAGMCRLSVERGGQSVSLPLLPDERRHLAALLWPDGISTQPVPAGAMGAGTP